MQTAYGFHELLCLRVDTLVQLIFQIADVLISPVRAPEPYVSSDYGVCQVEIRLSVSRNNLVCCDTSGQNFGKAVQRGEGTLSVILAVEHTNKQMVISRYVIHAYCGRRKHKFARTSACRNFGIEVILL